MPNKPQMEKKGDSLSSLCALSQLPNWRWGKKGDIPRHDMSRTIKYTYGKVCMMLFLIIENIRFDPDSAMKV